MTPDVKLKNFYLKFIYDAKGDIADYKKQLNDLLNIKNELINYINDYKTELLESFNIDLNEYTEWVNKTYDKKEKLFNKSFKTLNILDNVDINKSILIQLIKYCNIIKKEHTYNRSIYLASLRSNLKYEEYRNYVTTYYNKVHKCCLEGYGYKYGFGIGTYCINRWQINKSVKNYKPIIDFNETNKRKKELLNKGYKLYNEEDAKLYAAKGIPYDGVKYTVYKSDKEYYEFTFINSAIFKDTLEYKRTEYINKQYRGLSYKDIADKYCKTIDDIYNLQVDIKYKFNILLYLYPIKYINFIRNLDETKYKFRENNSENRQ